MQVLEYLVEAVARFCERRGRIFKITGTGGPDDVYLIRYYVVQSRWFNIFIHRFMRSDRDDCHDHPWDFITFLVKGAYTERKWNPQTREIDETRRAHYLVNKSHGIYFTKNRFVSRKATDQHQVVLDSDLKPGMEAEATLTVCVTGRTKREWGFWKEITVQNDGIIPISEKYRPIREWVPWKKYLGLPEDTPGRG